MTSLQRHQTINVVTQELVCHMHSKPRGSARLQKPLQGDLASVQPSTGQKQLGHKSSRAFTQPGTQISFTTLHGNEVTKNKALCYHSNNTLKSLQRRNLNEKNVTRLSLLSRGTLTSIFMPCEIFHVMREL